MKVLLVDLIDKKIAIIKQVGNKVIEELNIEFYIEDDIDNSVVTINNDKTIDLVDNSIDYIVNEIMEEYTNALQDGLITRKKLRDDIKITGVDLSDDEVEMIMQICNEKNIDVEQALRDFTIRIFKNEKEFLIWKYEDKDSIKDKLYEMINGIDIDKTIREFLLDDEENKIYDIGDNKILKIMD